MFPDSGSGRDVLRTQYSGTVREMKVKENAFHVIESQTDAARLVGALLAMELDQDLYGALVEVITARTGER